MTASIFDGAKPIWTHEENRPNVYAEFCEHILWDGNKDCPVILTLSVDTQFAAYVNGELAATGQYTDYPDAKVYEERELTVHLHHGDNELRIVAYCQNTPSSTYRPGKPYIIYQVRAGESLLCASGEKSLCRRHPHFVSGAMEKVTGQLGYSFRYNAQQMDETSWMPAAVIGGVTERFAPRPIDLLCIGQPAPVQLWSCGDYRESTPGEAPSGVRMQRAWLRSGRKWKKMFPSEEGIVFKAPEDADGICVVLDLGQETVGFLSLDLAVPEDCEILIGWGEHLDDGRVRTEVGGRNFAAQYLAHAGENHFFNPFRRLGLRYLQLHIAAHEATLRYAGVCPVDYPLPASHFSCADPLHDRILSVGLRTLALCMHEHYEDCPWREQALYAMDSRNQMLCGYYAFGEYRFARASLALMAHSLREDGQLELCSPAKCPITIPSFTAVWVTALGEYLSHSGDEHFAREMLPTARRILRAFLGRIEAEKGGLIACYTEERYWNFYEWQRGLSGSIQGGVSAEDRTYDAPLCAFVSMALRAMEKICCRLGEEDTEMWHDARLKLNRAIHCHFFDAEQGLYASYQRCMTGENFHYAALTQALCLCAGVCPEKEQARVRANLASGEGLLPVTLSHSIYQYDALMQDSQTYAPLVRGEIERIWGGMLAAGATTFWETEKGADDFSFAGSLCHGWSAVPVYLYGRYHKELGLALKNRGK